jgi:hypothetical protein
MTMSLKIRGWIFALAFGLSASMWAQEASQSLGDVARKTRKEHGSASHVPAKQVTNEEEDGPDAGGVWRVKLCSRTPCYELSISLPKNPKWIRPAAEPRPVLIPLVGHEDDLSHAIRVYAAESIGPNYPQLDVAKRAFLQGWFARPEYFGQAAHLVLDEHTAVDGGQAIISHFTLISGGIKFRGVGVVATAPNGNYGFACAFREEDTEAANSVCDGIVKSAHGQILEASRPQYYPTYYPPQYYPRYERRYDDPPDDPED